MELRMSRKERDRLSEGLCEKVVAALAQRRMRRQVDDLAAGLLGHGRHCTGFPHLSVEFAASWPVGSLRKTKRLLSPSWKRFLRTSLKP